MFSKKLYLIKPNLVDINLTQLFCLGKDWKTEVAGIVR